MAVESIGGALESTNTNLSQSTLTQNDFVKLFLTELQFQDPLEPINNREFLAQMAQFANLEQSRIANENASNLVAMSAISQSLSLLGKTVEVSGQTGQKTIGKVSTISFSPEGAILTVVPTDTPNSPVTGIRLSQIVVVK
jgi:flagellar basal-body rod modification protein FlgD